MEPLTYLQQIASISLLEEIAQKNYQAAPSLPTSLAPACWASDIIEKYCLFKLDSQTKAGSYKLRGALHAARTAADGVSLVAASTGNHAISVAIAGNLEDKRSVIFVDSEVSSAKLSILKREGLELIDLPAGPVRPEEIDMVQSNLKRGQSMIIRVDGGFEKAQSAAEHAQTAMGLWPIHPFDDAHGFVGNMTIGVEIRDALHKLDPAGNLANRRIRLVVPAGGGGYGVATYAGCKVAGLNVKLTLVELEGQNCCDYALRNGCSEPKGIPDGVTDRFVPSTAVGQMGKIAFDLAREGEVDVKVVTSRQVTDAYHELWRGLRLEPSTFDVQIELAPAMAWAGLKMLRDIDEDIVILAISGGNISKDEISNVSHLSNHVRLI